MNNDKDGTLRIYTHLGDAGNRVRRVMLCKIDCYENQAISVFEYFKTANDHIKSMDAVWTFTKRVYL